MKVYSLYGDFDHFQSLALRREEDWDILLDWFKGFPIVNTWWPISVEILRDEGEDELPPSDFPYLHSGIPVFSARAVETLRDILLDNGEILPLNCVDGQYYAFNVTRLVDALDEKRSLCSRFSDGRIMNIIRHEFIAIKLRGIAIFKLSQLYASLVYVTDLFVSRVHEAGLIGFDFRPVWSEPDPRDSRGEQ